MRGPTRKCAGSCPLQPFLSLLGEICHRHTINFHGYADDSQNYMSFRPQYHNTVNQDASIKNLENCLEDLRAWMSLNFLKLSENKTEFIIVGVQQQFDKVRELSIKVGDDKITNSAVVKNLGVYIDSELKLLTHVNKIVSSSFNTLWNISGIRHHLDCDSTKILVQALIILDIIGLLQQLVSGDSSIQCGQTPTDTEHVL